MILEIFLVWICIILFQHGRRCQNACLARYIKNIGEEKGEEERNCNAHGAACGFFLSTIAIIGIAVLLFQ